jgi:hypothetical protein
MVTGYLNGVQDVQKTNFAGPTLSNTIIGAYDFAGFPDAFAGNMDDIRVTSGTARYTSNFTPPTAPFPDFSTFTIKGKDILALIGVRNVSTRDFVFIKNLASPAQPRITTASNTASSGVTIQANSLLKASPSSVGNYQVQRGGIVANALQINGNKAASLSISPFTGTSADCELIVDSLNLNAIRFTESMPSGAIASADKAIKIESDDLILYTKAGQS